MNLVKIKAADYGLTETKAADIAKLFKPMLDKMVELEDEFNEVIQKDMTEDLIPEAKALRKKYVAVRTGTAAIHKELKSFYLQGGRFVDGWKSAQIMAGSEHEAKLKAIETHYIDLERKRIKELAEHRAVEALKYEFEEPHLGFFGAMTEQSWPPFLEGLRVAHQNREAAKKLAVLEDQREQEKLKAERARFKQQKESMRKLQAEKASKAQELADMVLKDKNRVLAEERQKAQEDAAIKAESERLLSRGDMEKVNELVAALKELSTKYEFKSERNKKMYLNFKGLIIQILKNIKLNAE